MTILFGTIKDISKNDPGNKGFIKKVAHLSFQDNQTAFIEFRGDILNHLDSFTEGDQVAVTIQMKTSVSKKSGIRFNNLIAKSIKKIDSPQNSF